MQVFNASVERHISLLVLADPTLLFLGNSKAPLELLLELLEMQDVAALIIAFFNLGYVLLK